MPVGVVDLFKKVQVEYAERDRLDMGVLELAGEALEELAPVEEARELVGYGQLIQLVEAVYLGPHQGPQFVGVERLGQVGVGAGLQGRDTVIDPVGRRDEYERDKTRFDARTYLAAELVAVKLGQVDLRDDDVRQLIGDDAERLDSGVRRYVVVIDVVQDLADEGNVLLPVRDHQDCFAITSGIFQRCPRYTVRKELISSLRTASAAAAASSKRRSGLWRYA